MPILNYTTKVDPRKTVSQIQAILARKADAVMCEYAAGQPTAVLFTITVNGQKVNFRLPCNVKGVLNALWNQKGVPHSYRNSEHATRVAWRIVKDWIEAQLALVEAQQAEMAEVFLPYAVIQTVDGERTMYQAFQTTITRGLLTAGEVKEPTDG